jgi:DNA-binding NarL/FixJ family response regulator
MREAIRGRFSPGEWMLHEPHLTSARAQLGEEAWQEALAEGRATSLEAATEYAFSGDLDDPPTTPVSQEPSVGEPARDLSGREREVMVLVARGLTNRQISAHLGISERTAGNHVGKILGKPGLRSRAQISSWAIEHELLAPDSE